MECMFTGETYSIICTDILYQGRRILIQCAGLLSLSVDAPERTVGVWMAGSPRRWLDLYLDYINIHSSTLVFNISLLIMAS